MDQMTKVERILDFARSEGLIPKSEKDAKISGRIHRTLLEAAKRRSGLTSETALLEYALARVAIEDNFAEEMEQPRGSLDKDLDKDFNLEF